jgi:altronate hydrolase
MSEQKNQPLPIPPEQPAEGAILKLDRRDNVAVALGGLRAGGVVRLQRGNLKLNQDIPAAHKVALRQIEAGEAVLKYGAPIGTASCPIRAGDWVHVHNLASGLEADFRLVRRERKAGRQPRRAPGSAGSFAGYRRADGRAGVRNELWILPTVGCANGMAQALAARYRREMPAGVEDLKILAHPYGCSQAGEDLERTRRTLAAAAGHPNAGAVLVFGLGCEDNRLEELRALIGRMHPQGDPRRILFLEAQEEEEEIEAGLKALRRLGAYASGFRRTSIPLSELKLGMKCGGSDAFSGISANPLVGTVADRLYDAGGTTVLTEVPEMFGAEQRLLDRCPDRDVFRRSVDMLERFRRMFTDAGQPVYDNPSPGNRDGGITTLEEKSLGCIQKGGRQPVVDVLDYGQQARIPGLNLAEGPGNDLVSVSVLAAAGVQMILFTTGRGTPLGSIVPVIKIASTSALSRHKPHWIDFDAGGLLQGESLPAAGKRLWELVLEVASGRRTRNEVNGYYDFLPFKDGTTE